MLIHESTVTTPQVNQLVALALIGGHLAGSVLDRGALYGGVAILVAGTALVTLGLLRLR